MSKSAIAITVDRRSYDGALQIAIGDGSTGFRIAGPKYDGAGTTLLRRVLTERDAREIKEWLDKIGTNLTQASISIVPEAKEA